MSNHVVKGDIVFECDACSATLETYTSNFDAARNRLTRERWKPYKETGATDWKHRCAGCQQLYQLENARAH